MIPGPVQPRVPIPLEIHPYFMIFVIGLFAVAFAFMAYSMTRQRSEFGLAGALRWFWAVVPLAILLMVAFVLMGQGLPVPNISP